MATDPYANFSAQASQPDPYAAFAAPAGAQPPMPVQGVISNGGALPSAKPPSEDDLRAQDAAIIKARGMDPATVMRAHNYQPGDVAHFISSLTPDEGQAPQDLNQISGDGSMIGRFIHGAGDVGTALDKGATWLQAKLGYKDADADLAYKNLLNGLIEQHYQQTKPPGFDAARMGGQIAAATPLLPGGGALRATGVQLAARDVAGPMTAAAIRTAQATNAARAVATGAGFAAVQPDATPVSVAAGAVTAPPLQYGGEVLADKVVSPALNWLGNKGAAMLAGTSLGDRLGIPADFTGKVLNPKYTGAPELSNQLDQAGITSHTVGDITGDQVIRAQEDALARNNPEMMALRLKENQQTAAHADKVVSDLRGAVNAEGWKGVGDLQDAVENGKTAAPGTTADRRGKQAQVLLTAINNSGDDWKRIAQNSGNLELMVNKLKADQLYDKAEAIAGLYGPVQPTTLAGSLKANIAALERDTAGDQSIVPYLKRIQAGLEDGTQPTDFASLRKMRTSLNDQLTSLTAPNSVVQNSNASRNAIGNVTSALNDDLDAYANSHSSGLRNAWKNASDFYRDNVVPYKDAEVGKILADQDPLALGQLFARKDPYSQQKMFDLLGNKGQAAVRAGLVEDALDAGERTATGAPMQQTFSSGKAASKLEQLQRNGFMGVAFPGGEDSWAASGLAKILRTVDRSDNVGFTPPTGVTAQSIGAKVEGNQTILGTVAKAYDWLNKDRLMALYSDPKGRALLVQASNFQPGSKAMLNLINTQLPKLAGVSAGRAMGSSQPVIPETPNDQRPPAP